MWVWVEEFLAREFATCLVLSVRFSTDPAFYEYEVRTIKKRRRNSEFSARMIWHKQVSGDAVPLSGSFFTLSSPPISLPPLLLHCRFVQCLLVNQGP